MSEIGWHLCRGYFRLMPVFLAQTLRSCPLAVKERIEIGVHIAISAFTSNMCWKELAKQICYSHEKKIRNQNINKHPEKLRYF